MAAPVTVTTGGTKATMEEFVERGDLEIFNVEFTVISLLTPASRRCWNSRVPSKLAKILLHKWFRNCSPGGNDDTLNQLRSGSSRMTMRYLRTENKSGLFKVKHRKHGLHSSRSYSRLTSEALKIGLYTVGCIMAVGLVARAASYVCSGRFSGGSSSNSERKRSCGCCFVRGVSPPTNIIVSKLSASQPSIRDDNGAAFRRWEDNDLHWSCCGCTY